MSNEYTAVIMQDRDWWLGWIEEVPGVNCQERSYEDLMESIRITLREALEFNRMDAIAAAVKDYRDGSGATYWVQGANSALSATMPALPHTLPSTRRRASLPLRGNLRIQGRLSIGLARTRPA